MISKLCNLNYYTIITAPVLQSVELDVKPGQLLAVVGQVGAGKSSLIQALLGEMEKHRGSVVLRVSVCACVYTCIAA